MKPDRGLVWFALKENFDRQIAAGLDVHIQLALECRVSGGFDSRDGIAP